MSFIQILKQFTFKIPINSLIDLSIKVMTRNSTEKLRKSQNFSLNYYICHICEEIWVVLVN